MKGDFSRQTFDKTKHYAGVLMQQGRVQVDADWNEQQAITQYRVEIGVADVLGPCGVPSDNPGFGLQPTPDGNDLFISPGRLYVDGILCELEATTPVAIDKFPAPNQVQVSSIISDNVAFKSDQWVEIFAGNEMADAPEPTRFKIQNVDPTTRLVTLAGTVTEISQEFAPQLRRLTTLRTQPDLPGFAMETTGGTYLAYLDVWLRHVTALDDPQIRDKALGPDTTTRTKVICQVKLLQLSGDSLPTPDAPLPEWDALIQRSSGRLNARAQPAITTVSTENLLLPPGAGYQRLENQLYRVEIHNGSDSGRPTFKWSRDNGSVVSAIESVSESSLTVHDVGRDEVLGFFKGQWVEIVDDLTELGGIARQLIQIAEVDESNRTITLKEPPAPSDRSLHPKLRRWEQSGVAATKEGVTVAESFQPLEDGIEVQFSKGTYHSGDYWLIPARTATGEIEWPPFEVPNKNPISQPPLGIRHHYCRLASVKLDGEKLSILNDLRKSFDNLIELNGSLVTQVLSSRRQGKDVVLHNGDAISSIDLARGLKIFLNRNIDPTSATRAACFVTLELPLHVDQQNVGFEPVVLAADIGMDQRNVIDWTPKTGYLVSQSLFNSALGEAAFLADWDVFPPQATAASWGYGTVGVEARVSSSDPRAFAGFMAINKQPIKKGASEMTMSCFPGGIASSEGPKLFAGLVFNFLSINDFWTIVASGEFFGIIEQNAILIITHYVNGRVAVKPDGSPETERVSSGNFSNGPTIKKVGFKLSNDSQFCGATFVYSDGVRTLGLATPALASASRVGLVNTIFKTDFSELQISYPSTSETYLPPVVRLLSRLTVKRDFLRLTDETAGAVPQGNSFSAPRPDFSMWFFVQLSQPAYGYGGRSGPGIARV